MALFQPQNSGTYTPADVERKRRLAEMLMSNTIDSRGPFDALAEGINAAHGGFEQQQASQGEQQGIAGASSRLGEILADPQVTLEKLAQAGGDPWNSQVQNSIISELIGKQVNPAAGLNPTSDIQNYEYGQTHPGFTDYQTQKGGASETSLQPTWLVDNDPASPTYGKPVIGQLNKAGVVVKSQLPEGVTAMDPGQIAGTKAAGVIDGKTQANAQALLPSASLAAQQTLDVIGKLRTDGQGLEETFGKVLGVLPQQWNPVTTPGTPKANFAALLNQAKGKVFLTAYQSLKGGGAITEVEGLKAEQALARLDTAQSKEAFLAALDDFEQAVKDGMEKLTYAASGGASDMPGAPDMGAPKHIQNDAEYDALPSGATFVGPDGVTRKKP